VLSGKGRESEGFLMLSHAVKKRISNLHPMGLKKAVIYGFFQRILRINSHVPWAVHWSSHVSSPEQIKIRPTSYRFYPGYMPGQYIQAKNGIVLGHNVWMGPGVKIISANHNLLNYYVYDEEEPIEIGDNCWLGSNAIILPGVKLGSHVVVAAGAVVTEDFPDNSLIGGVPARLIRALDEYDAQSFEDKTNGADLIIF
jgi:acetyltransferase-like isoleucine patch superfamily enzyme